MHDLTSLKGCQFHTWIFKDYFEKVGFWNQIEIILFFFIFEKFFVCDKTPNFIVEYFNESIPINQMIHPFSYRIEQYWILFAGKRVNLAKSGHTVAG